MKLCLVSFKKVELEHKLWTDGKGGPINAIDGLGANSR